MDFKLTRTHLKAGNKAASIILFGMVTRTQSGVRETTTFLGEKNSLAMYSVKVSIFEVVSL